MDLHNTEHRNHTLVQLEDVKEACLFTEVGLGMLSVKGIRTALQLNDAKAKEEWPFDVIVSNRRLRHARGRMLEEAAVLGTRVNFDSLPTAPEDELALRQMVSGIDEYLATPIQGQ